VISFRSDLKIMLATQPVDFRKSVFTLSALVSVSSGLILP
jgi:transposase